MRKRKLDDLDVEFIPEQLDEPDYLSIWDIKQGDWVEISLIADQFLKAGYFSGDHRKCFVAGFVNWLEFNDKAIIYDDALNRSNI